MNKNQVGRWSAVALLGGAALYAGAQATSPAQAENSKIGINVLLSGDVTDAALAELAQHGTVLEVIPEIDAVTLRADAAELSAIQSLACVAGAGPDRARIEASDGPTVPDFSGAANVWNLDAVDVTDAGAGRTVAFDGAGVYVAVMDTGLVGNWREYFPEERIATQFARSFGGGGGQSGTVSEQPSLWEHDTRGHGTQVTSILLGFRYAGPGALPASFNGVAPRATVIPVKVFGNNADLSQRFSSVLTRGLVYLTGLKTSGALGDAPLVVNMSFGGPDEDYVERAAIDYAVAHGLVLVACAGNEGDAGMIYPAAYPPVISVANVGWTEQVPPDDPTTFEWVVRDVPEGDASQYYVFPTSSRAHAGQDLDVSAPGAFVLTPFWRDGRVDYSFFFGTSAASPHVAGVAALMMQKNPDLTASQVEDILETTALPLAPGSATVTVGAPGPGNDPTVSDHGNAVLFDITTSWGADATGHGVVQADAALAATPPQ